MFGGGIVADEVFVHLREFATEGSPQPRAVHRAAIWREAWHLVAVEYKSYRPLMEAIVEEAEVAEARTSPAMTVAPS